MRLEAIPFQSIVFPYSNNLLLNSYEELNENQRENSVYNQARTEHVIHGAPQFEKLTDGSKIFAIKYDGGIMLVTDGI